MTTARGLGLALLVAASAAALTAANGSARIRADVPVAILQPTQGYFVLHNSFVATAAAVAVKEADAERGVAIPLRLVPIRYTRRAAASELIRKVEAAGSRIVILPCNDDAVPQLAAAAVAARLFVLSPC